MKKELEIRLKHDSLIEAFATTTDESERERIKAKLELIDWILEGI